MHQPAAWRGERRVARRAVSVLVVLAVAGTGAGCSDDASSDPGASASASASDAGALNRVTEAVVAEIELHEVSPPVAGRLVGYTGLAAHEAVAAGPDRSTWADRVAGLDPPPEPDGEVHWPVVVSAAAAATAAPLLVSEGSADRLAAVVADERSRAEAAGVDAAVLDRSEALGEAVAAGVLARSDADGYAEAGAAELTPNEDDPGAWVPTAPAFAPALEPAWGTLATLAVAPDDCPLEPPAAFSTEPGSAFHDEALAVYEADAALTAEQEEIARFWNMEPNTGTPAGHWARIATTVIAQDEVDLAEAAEVLGAAAVSMADAFVIGWKAKYDTDVVRPVTYIQEHVEPGWLPYLVTPPFPEYPSGHSFVSGAAAATLTALLGERSFSEGSNHEGVERSFSSFDEAATEAAESRLYGGAHYPMAVEAGNQLGTCIGRLAAERLEVGS